MMWEKREMIVILSKSRVAISKNRNCFLCETELKKGKKYLSINQVDRLYESKETIYLCNCCESYYAYESVEDAPHHVQKYLFDNRYAYEVWYQE